jgi:hypothetical protein
MGELKTRLQEGAPTQPLNVQTTSLHRCKAPLKRQKLRSCEVKKFGEAGSLR